MVDEILRQELVGLVVVGLVAIIRQEATSLTRQLQEGPTSSEDILQNVSPGTKVRQEFNDLLARTKRIQ